MGRRTNQIQPGLKGTKVFPLGQESLFGLVASPGEKIIGIFWRKEIIHSFPMLVGKRVGFISPCLTPNPPSFDYDFNFNY